MADNSYYGPSGGHSQRGYGGCYRDGTDSMNKRGRDNTDYSYDRFRREEDRGYHPQQLNGDDWKCLECSTWNYPQDYDCYRCRAPRELSSGGTLGDGRRTKEGNPFAEKLDEFGRDVSKKLKTSSKWPPAFDSNGSVYTLDPSSGMFYEAVSDFFYDPKTKLYYGNKNKLYYRYNPDTRKYEEAPNNSLPAPNETLNPTPIMDSLQGTNLAAAEGKRKAISINLKTKTLGTSVKPSTEPRISKKHAKDMEKWSERQVEIKAENPKATTEADKIPTTAKGEPICLLCRRKFPNLDKLQYHEKASQLHQENLAKKKKQQPETTTYVDRAEQRRALHGPETAVVAAHRPDAPSVVSLGTTTTTIGESNLGHQMLQKMGWKKDDTSATPIEQDWQRIESLAAKNASSNNNNYYKRW